MIRISAITIVCFLLFSGQAPQRTTPKKKGESRMSITMVSKAFKQGEMIPKKYTCDGENISPPLAWTGIPEGTKSIALIADDPDAPRGTWVHWVLFNLPAETKELPENIPPRSTLSNGARHGITDFRELGYGGPCPPGGTHRYFFKLYALDSMLTMESGATKAQVLKAMEGHVLGEGELMGKYKR